jgi:hypothetical protein
MTGTIERATAGLNVTRVTFAAGPADGNQNVAADGCVARDSMMIPLSGTNAANATSPEDTVSVRVDEVQTLVTPGVTRWAGSMSGG